MAKNVFFSVALLSLCSASAFAQSKIKDGSVTGSSSLPNANAVADLESNKKGLLIPRVPLSSTSLASPLTAHVAGMLVYNTATAGSGSTAVSPGYYYDNGTSWVRIANEANSSKSWNDVATAAPATSNTQNIYQMGLVGINLSSTPAEQLEVNGNIKGDRFIGYGTGGVNTCSAVGLNALQSNKGEENTATGVGALSGNVSGNRNTATGFQALNKNDNGVENTATGDYSMQVSNGSYNTSTGAFSLYKNEKGNYNTANGHSALYSNIYGENNSATGWNTLFSNEDGSDNTANGSYALYSLKRGKANTGLGVYALYTLERADANTAVGTNSLYQNIANNNTALGTNALSDVTKGSNNTGLGYNAQVPDPTADNQVTVGDANIAYAGVQVAWTITSDKRWKNDIRTIPYGLNLIQQLRPVDYIRKNTSQNSFNANTRESGFVAQEVKETLKQLGYENSGIVTQDKNGFYGLRYNDFIPVLVKAVQEQQTELELLKAENEALKKEQLALAQLAEQVRELQQLAGVIKTQDNKVDKK